MSVLSPARAMALVAVSRTFSRNAYASMLMEETVHKSSAAPSDKDFAELLTYGVVSTYGTLDEFIDRNLNSPDDIRENVRNALRISAYELLFLGKADHAVVDQGVELVRSTAPKAARLANAVLRKMSVDAKEFPWGDVDTDNAALARSFGFPPWLAESLILEMGRAKARVFMDASNKQAPLFIACNFLKSTEDEVFKALEDSGAKPSFFDKNYIGCIVAENKKPAVNCEVLKDARALVADGSAQLAAQIAAPMQGKRFLEIGGGRGTKTILLQSHAFRLNGKQADLYSLDMHEFKRDVLEARAKDFGVNRLTLLVGDATHIASIPGIPESFGKAIIDAPCSGIGTLRRHPEIRWKVTKETICSLSKTGKKMLEEVSSLIETGGSIVYSTCTPTREEDEDVIEGFLDSKYGADFRISKIDGSDYFKCDLNSGGPDAHFIAKLEKIR